MSDRTIPPLLHIAGGLVPYEGVDRQIAVIRESATLRDFQVVLDVAPSGGSFQVQFGTTPGVPLLTVTVADGNLIGRQTGSFTVTAGQALYQRIVQANGAFGMWGHYEAISASAAGPVAPLLTTLERVKRYEDIKLSEGRWDDLLNLIIADISLRFQNAIRTLIVRQDVVGERHDGQPWPDLVLDHRPVIAGEPFELRSGAGFGASETGTVVDPDTYEVRHRSGIVRSTGGAWGGGRSYYQVDYPYGYLSVPEDIQGAVTDEVRARFKKTGAGGKDRLGLDSQISDRGTASYQGDEGWLPETLVVIRSYRELHA